ncbi:MAG TPA: alkaline phosphatase PafA [Chryseosolibacter sp.]|nr:alkaline phosphatase PafA [Chryseosolibacter sp.]
MKIIFACVWLVISLSAFSQNPQTPQPKLVVGIVVDQMRQEYLYRFSDKYSEGGFKRLMSGGFELKNAHYNYAPTVTGPGHASVFTGTTPAIHGIIGNEWYDKNLRKHVNCVGDPQHRQIGAEPEKLSASPWRLLASTITDELRLATQKRGKVVGVALKDRGAILPAGHTPTGAYWFHSESGRFITSTYYAKSLPEWVTRFNQQNLPEKYLSGEWKTFFPIERYVESGTDDTPYETKFEGKDKTVFPYNLKELRKKNGELELLVSTPFADDLLTEFAKATIAGEALGTDAWTDFLTVSFSAPDIIGHAFGPNAVEVADTYVRLDRNIEDLLKYLDENVGRDQYLVFLTADHGVADVAQYLTDNRIPAGYFNAANVKSRMNEFLKDYFPGKEIVEAIESHQIFLNHGAFQPDPKGAGVDFLVATELVTNFLLAEEGVANAFPESVLRQSDFNEGGIKGQLTRGYHPKRSGDIIIALEPGWYSGSRVQGTTHGSPYTYDTHVPVLFYGAGIPKGSSVLYHRITDIAPTLSLLLNIKLPNGCTGQPIAELFERR